MAKEDVLHECHVAINNVLLPVKETKNNRQALADGGAHMEHRFDGCKLAPEDMVQRT